jgi:putative Mn2+ efflux pump MntP
MLNVQELVGGVLTSVAGSLANRIPTLYMAIGAALLILVGTYFVYKWFFSAPEKTTESFVEPVNNQPPSPHVSFAPHIEVSEIPNNQEMQEQQQEQDQEYGQDQDQEQDQEHGVPEE